MSDGSGLRGESLQTLAVAALESSVDGVIAIDEDGFIRMVNPAVERIFGYAREEILGEKINVLMPQPYRDEHDDYIGNYKATGHRKIIGIGRQVEGRRKGGAVFPMHLTVVEVRPHGRRMFVGTVRDVSARVKAETERGRLEEQLLQSQKMEAVGRLGGGVAHDFNTLLGSIRGFSEMILDRCEDGPSRRHAEQIHRAAERGAALTRRLLAFSRPRPHATEVLDLNALVEDLADMLRHLVSEEIELVYDLQPGLWPVEADPSQLEQSLVNLVINAADAIQGGGRIEIRTRDLGATVGGDDHDRVRLTVADTGHGMDEATRERVFEPFFTTKDPGRGTGLGLFTVYTMVRQHQGRIHVDSRPGEGCRFDVDLPRASGPVAAAAAAEESGPEEASPAAAADPPPNGPERGAFLVVEDDPTFLAMLRELLESRGWEVLTARDPQRALEILDQEGGGVELLLTDVVMPGMTGLELVDAVRERHPGVRPLLMSGYADDVVAERRRADQGDGGTDERFPGGVERLQKPFGIPELLAAVERTLERRNPTG